MDSIPLNLNGYTDLPVGKVAFVATYLAMQRPERMEAPADPDGLVLDLWHRTGYDAYRALFRAVCKDWLWYSRLMMSEEDLASVLSKEATEVYVPKKDGAPVGLLELDYSAPGDVELVYFGLVPDAIGTGIGAWLMAKAVDMVWSRAET